MADIGLLTRTALARLTAPNAPVVVETVRGGTNRLLVHSSEFRLDYPGTSFIDHCIDAVKAGLKVVNDDSFQLATDIVESDDLIELRLSGLGRAEYLNPRFALRGRRSRPQPYF
jgi:2-phospho-L-lactate guanylyltransferase